MEEIQTERMYIDNGVVHVGNHGRKLVCAFSEVTERCGGEETFGRYFTMIAVCWKCQLKQLVGFGSNTG